MGEYTLQELIDAANARSGRKKRKPEHRESRHQMSVVAYARAKWPEVPIVCSTGGKKMSGKAQWQRMKQGSINKKEGYEPGTPDLFFSAARRGFHGLYIEMKDEGEPPSSCSDEQKAFILRAKAQGYEGVFCFGDKQAIKILDWYFGD